MNEYLELKIWLLTIIEGGKIDNGTFTTPTPYTLHLRHPLHPKTYTFDTRKQMLDQHIF